MEDTQESSQLSALGYPRAASARLEVLRSTCQAPRQFSILGKAGSCQLTPNNTAFDSEEKGRLLQETYCREKLAPRVSFSPSSPGCCGARNSPFCRTGALPPTYHSTESPATASFHLPELNSSGRALKAAVPQATCSLPPIPLLTLCQRALGRCHHSLWVTVLSCGWPWLFASRKRVPTQGRGSSPSTRCLSALPFLPLTSFIS